jgi:predicted acetyltransferase
VADRDRTVRTIDTDAELAAFLRGMMTAFLADRVVGDEHVTWAKGRFDLARTWAAFDGDVQCGSERTFPTTLRLPGLAEVPVSCLTNVTVLPTHTRRGHLGRLMRAQLDAAVETGEVASLLVAAEWPIYGRFGYGPATEYAAWGVDTLLAEVAAPAVGECELVEADAFDAATAEVLDRQHATTPGAIGRPDWLRQTISAVTDRPWEPADKTTTWVVHRDAAGRADGVVVYTVKEDWDGMRPSATASIRDLVVANPGAERELWRYLVEIDLVTKVTWNGDPSSVLRHAFVNGRAARQVGRWDHVWARILDVPACLTARSYDRTERLVLEVGDPFLDRGGRFVLDTGPGGASCEPTDEPADVVLPVAALGAAWLGGTDLRQVAAGGSVVEQADGAVERLAALLRWHRTPFCVTDF